MRHFVTTGLLLAIAEAYSIPQNILAAVKSADSAQLVTDLSTISRYWGMLTPYSDNAPDLWGVQDVGIPAGCQVGQAHVLQRHTYCKDTRTVSLGALMMMMVAMINVLQKGARFRLRPCRDVHRPSGVLEHLSLRDVKGLSNGSWNIH